jgi:hypothetical protein
LFSRFVVSGCWLKAWFAFVPLFRKIGSLMGPYLCPLSGGKFCKCEWPPTAV